METNFDTMKGWLTGFLLVITVPPGALFWYGLDSGAVWAIVLGAILISPGLAGWLIFGTLYLANEEAKSEYRQKYGR